MYGDTPKYPTSRQHFQILSRRRDVTRSSDDDEDGEVDSDLDNTTIHPIYARAISFQKRQALVTYLENNKAGITVYGFLVDKTWLRMIFSIELALLLWLLKKTIVLLKQYAELALLFKFSNSMTKMTPEDISKIKSQPFIPCFSAGTNESPSSANICDSALF
ncbi:hypothetical protein F2Q70_00002614 [Brassica cretica]|uniref:Uncharacterized protein n=1 Tax=Brassica cretica TaxID=69181 RepID=A0A8S9IVM0_BRACR|nr:hypothetical protein F2Q70_00002614 [Brassica cretica]